MEEELLQNTNSDLSNADPRPLDIKVPVTRESGQETNPNDVLDSSPRELTINKRFERGALEALGSMSRFNLANGLKYYTNISIQKYERNSLTALFAKGNTIANYQFPLPINMTAHHNVAYAQQELGMLAGGATGLAFGENDPRQNAGNEQLSTLQNSAAGLFAAEAAGQAFPNVLGGVIGSLISKGAATTGVFAGVAPNPFQVIMLKGPSYRKHNLSWKLSPRSQQESIMLNEALRSLNNAMAPSMALGGAIFLYPKIFNISYMPSPEYLYRFKPAVMTDLVVNYTGAGGPAMYRTGAPVTLDVTMSFTELEFWLSGDF